MKNTEKMADIIREFCDLNVKSGGNCSEWCIGVTDDVERRLFCELRIPRDYRWCIYRRAVSAEEARAIVQGFFNIGYETCLDPKGGERAIFVFAYRKLVAASRDVARNQLRA